MLPGLKLYSWPGNVRELKHAIERAVVSCDGDVLLQAHFPRRLFEGSLQVEPTGGSRPTQTTVGAGAAGGAELDASRFAAQINALERTRIVEALNKTGGNQTQAAKLLGMARRTLIAQMQAHQLPRPRKPPG